MQSRGICDSVQDREKAERRFTVILLMSAIPVASPIPVPSPVSGSLCPGNM